uniref:Uncharacterized protein n=1 Tax=Arundo donax TaxID=35708 RepID=A0A0A9GA05_ARUDO
MLQYSARSVSVILAGAPSKRTKAYITVLVIQACQSFYHGVNFLLHRWLRILSFLSTFAF